MRAVIVVLSCWGLGSGCATGDDARWQAERALQRQVYASRCAPIKETVLAQLADEQLERDSGDSVETAWRSGSGDAYERRWLVQLIEAGAPTCQVVAHVATRDTRRGAAGAAGQVRRAYALEREVLRVHDPETYARLPLVEFW